MFKRCRNVVKTNNIETGKLTDVEGLRQGSVFSTSLFILIMEYVVKETTAEVAKLHIYDTET